MTIQRTITDALILVDGKEVEHTNVLVLPIDQLMFEKTARAKGWSVTDNPLAFVFFSTWHALKRTGKYTGGFDAFMDAALSIVEHTPDEDDGEDEAGPTRRAR